MFQESWISGYHEGFMSINHSNKRLYGSLFQNLLFDHRVKGCFDYSFTKTIFFKLFLILLSNNTYYSKNWPSMGMSLDSTVPSHWANDISTCKSFFLLLIFSFWNPQGGFTQVTWIGLASHARLKAHFQYAVLITTSESCYFNLSSIVQTE